MFGALNIAYLLEQKKKSVFGFLSFGYGLIIAECLGTPDGATIYAEATNLAHHQHTTRDTFIPASKKKVAVLFFCLALSIKTTLADTTTRRTIGQNKRTHFYPYMHIPKKRSCVREQISALFFQSQKEIVFLHVKKRIKAIEAHKNSVTTAIERHTRSTHT